VAIDSAARRNSALIDCFGVVTPDGAIGDADRQTLIGQYGSLIAFTGSLAIDLYIEQLRVVVTGAENEADGMKIERSRAVNVYIDQARSINLGAL